MSLKDLKTLYKEISSRSRPDAMFASQKRQDLAEPGETAFLIEKTDQQSFLTLMAGTIATGSVQIVDIFFYCRQTISGLIYTALLILKPTNTCSARELRRTSDEEFHSAQDRPCFAS